MEDDRIYFEDINIGDKISSLARTVTETDLVNFAGLSGDYSQIHTDAEFAKNSVAGQRIAHGYLGMTIASGLFSRSPHFVRMSQSILALMEIRGWRFLKPLCIGDTIHVVVEIIDKKDIYANRGQVLQKRSVVNQRGETVQEGEAVMLIAKAGKNR